MIDIWNIIAELGVELHSDLIGAAAAKLATLNSPNEFEKAKPSFGLGIDRSLIEKLAKAWKDTPNLTPRELAAALRGASASASLVESNEAVEMVWTGPSTSLAASRHTEQVLLELIATTKHRLFIVSFVAYDIESVMRSLQNAISKNIKVEILLESSKSHGGKIDIDSIKAFRKQIPSAILYAWCKESKSSDRWDGAVHAKCAVADGSLAFITSANMTGAAMKRNMELGVLIRGGKLPEKLERHLQALITIGALEQV